jgi:hypothetical protein
MAHVLTHAQVTELAIGDKRERKRFVALERELLGSEPLFVAETGGDLAKRLAGRSAFVAETDRTLLVASNGRDVARCAPVINRRWQRDRGDDVGFIAHFAAAPGAHDAVAAMLDAAERWIRERGVRRVLAPFSGDTFHGLATRRLAESFGGTGRNLYTVFEKRLG